MVNVYASQDLLQVHVDCVFLAVHQVNLFIKVYVQLVPLILFTIQM